MRRAPGVLLCLVLLVSAGFDLPAAPLRAGSKAPACRLPDLAGNRISVPGDFQGKIVVLHFWASWCPPCKEEMKALQSLQESLGENGFVPLSIDVGEQRAAVEDAVRPLGLSYTVLLDSDSSAARTYGVSGLPMTFILDRSGTIRYKILGEIQREGLRKLISTLP